MTAAYRGRQAELALAELAALALAPDPAAGVRWVIVRIPEASLVDYLTGRRVLVNVPPDARIVGVRVESEWTDGREFNKRVAVTLEHASFAAVLPGCRVPRMQARCALRG